MKNYISIVCLFILHLSYSQTSFPTGFFRSPIDTAIKLNGNFAELRSNHFHGGLDIATGSREGMKVHAVADGYVYKIKVSPFGYGNMLQIRHENGYVSVYAHLQQFNDSIKNYVRKVQYANKSFEVELYPKPNELKVKIGDVIALSGNSGGSEGPHLHFEIRDSTTEIAYNPLLFGFEIKDTRRPTVYGLTIYPENDTSYINGENRVKRLKITQNKGEYKIPEVVSVSGNFYFGVEAIDTEDNSTNRNGVYSVELQLDGKRIYFFEMQRVPFADNRYINTHIDYLEKLKSSRSIHKCIIEPNNKLAIYKDVVSNGVITINDKAKHEIAIVVKDYFGNTSMLNVKVKGNGVVKTQRIAKPIGKQPFFECKNDNVFNTSDFSITLPKGWLYNDFKFNYSVSDTLSNGFSALHYVQDKYVPVHDYYKMAIRTKNIPDRLKSKLLIVSNESGIRGIKDCNFDSNWVSCNVRTFGTFKVVVDTIPPSIKPLNISNTKSLTQQQDIKIAISDRLSGIKDYSAKIDKQWVLMEYDSKSNRLTYTFDESVKSGEHLFELEVTDERNNKANYMVKFFK